MPRKNSNFETIRADPSPEMEKAADETVRQISEKAKAAKTNALNQLNAAKKKILLETITDTIYTFCGTFTGRSLYEYQKPLARRIIKSIILNDGAKMTALFSRQSGKTEIISYVISGCLILMPKLSSIGLETHFPALTRFKEGLWVGIFAPVLDQASTMFKRIRGKFSAKRALEILSDVSIGESVETSNGAVISISSGSFVECRSAAPTSNIESKTYHVLVCDESQDIDSSKIRKSISPMGAATRASMVMAGTCNTQKSQFYEQIIVNKTSALANPDAEPNHFEYNYKIVQKYNEQYRLYIQDEINSYGEDSDEFRMSYNLEWIFERGMFVSEQMLEDRVFVPNLELGEWKKFGGWSTIASIDYGKSQDSTILTYGVVNWAKPIEDMYGESVFYKSCVLGWLELFGDDWDTQYFQLMDVLCGLPRLQKLVCDATGVGAGITDRLRNALSDVEVLDYVYSVQSKSDGYKFLSMAISKGIAWVPGGADTRKTREHKFFIQQMTDLTKEYRGQNMLVSAPPNIRHAHDDYPDSFMMFVHAAMEPATAMFAVEEYSPFSGRGGNWFLRD